MRNVVVQNISFNFNPIQITVVILRISFVPTCNYIKIEKWGNDL
jgi:hypothetical protein